MKTYSELKEENEKRVIHIIENEILLAIANGKDGASLYKSSIPDFMINQLTNAGYAPKDEGDYFYIAFNK
jgi:hypothetical protein